MTSNFDVTVIARDGATVSLRIVSADDQQWAIPREDLALQLLREAASEHPDREGAFSREVSFEDVIDEGWQRRFARGFVRSVRLTDETAGKVPTGVLHIEVTHPAWLHHLHWGDVWESYAYEVCFEFDDCAPITPGSVDTTIADPGDSFLYVPRAAWGTHLRTGPALLEIPAYSPTAYTTRDTINDPRQIPADWVGRAVRIMAEDLLHPEDGSFTGKGTWAQMDAHSYGGRHGHTITSIARLVPKAGRRGGKFTYAKALDRVQGELVDSRRSGSDVELSFRIPPDLRELALYKASHVLRLLAGEWWDPDEPDGRTDLARALAADAERLATFSDLMERIADTYIASYEITYEPGRDLDNLPQHEVIAVLTAQWPKAKLAITMTDERWAAAANNQPRHVETHAVAARSRPS